MEYVMCRYGGLAFLSLSLMFTAVMSLVVKNALVQTQTQTRCFSLPTLWDEKELSLFWSDGEGMVCVYSSWPAHFRSVVVFNSQLWLQPAQALGDCVCVDGSSSPPSNRSAGGEGFLTCKEMIIMAVFVPLGEDWIYTSGWVLKPPSW